MESTSTMLRKAMFAIVLSGLFGNVALADSLVIDGISSANAANHPARGATKADVVAKFGEPTGQNGPVGEPPISSWDYGSFVVYFEYDRVLHAVAKRR